MAADPGKSQVSELAAERMRELADAAIASGRPLSWYDALYKSAEAGTGDVPWDHGEPMPALVDWLAERYPKGAIGQRAIVVGCGYGHDAEYMASLGFTATAFDISATAIEVAGRRHGRSGVDYQQADLLAVPTEWLRGFNLVVESTTLQCLPPALHEQAAAAVAGLAASGGTVIVIARQPSTGDPSGPPWLLKKAEIESVAVNGVELVRLETVSMNGGSRWVAEFRRLSA